MHRRRPATMRHRRPGPRHRHRLPTATQRPRPLPPVRHPSAPAAQFGHLGPPPPAYNAGPARLPEFLSGRPPLPGETRHYVLAIPGISVDEWASSGKREPLHVPKAGCGELMALLHRAPNPFVQKLEERVNVVAAAPWGVQLAAGFSPHPPPPPLTPKHPPHTPNPPVQ